MAYDELGPEGFVPDYSGPDEFEPESTTRLERSLAKLNQVANEDRIKLETLKNCYITLARAYHELLKIDGTLYHNLPKHQGDWKQCQDGACPSNLEVLVKLELI